MEMKYYFELVMCKHGLAKAHFFKARFHYKSRKNEVVLNKAKNHIDQAIKDFFKYDDNFGLQLCKELQGAFLTRDSSLKHQLPSSETDSNFIVFFPDYPQSNLLLNFITSVNKPKKKEYRKEEEDDEAKLQVHKKHNSELISPSKRNGGGPKEKHSFGSKIGKKPEGSFMQTHVQIYEK